MTNVLTGRYRRERNKEEKWKEKENGAMCLQVKAGQETPAASRSWERGVDSHSEPPRRTFSVSPLSLDFWLPEQ